MTNPYGNPSGGYPANDSGNGVGDFTYQPLSSNDSGAHPTGGQYGAQPSGATPAAGAPSGGVPQQPGYGAQPFDAPDYNVSQPYPPAQTYGAPNAPAPQGYGQGPQQPFGQPGPGQAGYGAPGQPLGAMGATGPGGPAPFGYDPATGLPYSDKSKVAAGLLQLFLGTLGVGRFYLGDSSTGGIQLALFIVGFITSFLFIGFFILAGLSIWVLIDAIMILTGSVRDPQGRPLR